MLTVYKLNEKLKIGEEKEPKWNLLFAVASIKDNIDASRLNFSPLAALPYYCGGRHCASFVVDELSQSWG